MLNFQLRTKAAGIDQKTEAEVSRTGKSVKDVLRAIVGITSGRANHCGGGHGEADERAVKKHKARKNEANKVKAKDNQAKPTESEAIRGFGGHLSEGDQATAYLISPA